MVLAENRIDELMFMTVVRDRTVTTIEGQKNALAQRCADITEERDAAEGKVERQEREMRALEYSKVSASLRRYTTNYAL